MHEHECSQVAKTSISSYTLTNAIRKATHRRLQQFPKFVGTIARRSGGLISSLLIKGSKSAVVENIQPMHQTVIELRAIDEQLAPLHLVRFPISKEILRISTP